MDAVFIKLLNMSISASWLILAVVIIRLFLKKAPRWSVCLLWGLVALKLIVPFSFKSIFSLIPSDEVIPETIATEVHPHINSGIIYVDTAINPVMEAHLAPQVGDSANPMQVVVFIASLVWCIGMIMCLLYAMTSFIILKRGVRASKKISDNVYACDEVKSPFILGIFRPVIYIPSGMSRDILEYVIDHENAHLKRGDHFWKPLGFLLLSVYWFNPLCWVAYILLCRDIEFACDEKVIRDKDNAYVNSYSQALLDCNAHRRIIAACPLAFGETSVKDRIKGVLNYKKPAFWVIIVAVIACIVVAVCFMTDPKKKTDNNSAGGTGIVDETENRELNVYPEDHVEDAENRVYLGDIDQDGTEEYIDYHSYDDRDTYNFTWELYYDDEAIYHGTNVIPCDFGEVWYIDLDDDAEKEIFVEIFPHVNSMPQTQYVALKRTVTGWKELENTDVGYESDSYTNAFPIHVYKGKGKNLIVISCEGCGNTVEYDVTEHYTQLMNQDGDLLLRNLANDILNTDQYNSPGITMGESAAWGVWELTKGSFDGKDCIVATHGVQGLGGKFDIIGTADVYFRYDAMGEIKVLDLEFKAENENNDVVSDNPLGLTREDAREATQNALEEQMNVEKMAVGEQQRLAENLQTPSIVSGVHLMNRDEDSVGSNTDEQFDVLSATALPMYKNNDYFISSCELSATQVTYVVTFDTPVYGDRIVEIYFRKADGELITLQQLAGNWTEIKFLSEGAPAQNTYRYTQSLADSINPLSVSGVVMNGVEYSFMNDDYYTGVDIPDTLRPFLSPFAERNDTFYVYAYDACKKMGAVIENDGRSYKIRYRGNTLELSINEPIVYLNGNEKQTGSSAILEGEELLVPKTYMDCLGTRIMMYYPERGPVHPPKEWLITP